ncbi:hypothetical protein ACOMHN_034817 [Nucella lapillus]
MLCVQVIVFIGKPLKKREVDMLCCSHAAHFDSTITATHRPVALQPQEPEVHWELPMSGRRGATYQKRPCTSARSLRWCSLVPFYRTTY